jgi:hypothetical protein
MESMASSNLSGLSFLPSSPASAVRCKPTANSKQPTANSQQPPATSHQPTANSKQPTANGRGAVLLLSCCSCAQFALLFVRESATGLRPADVCLGNKRIASPSSAAQHSAEQSRGSATLLLLATLTHGRHVQSLQYQGSRSRPHQHPRTLSSCAGLPDAALPCIGKTVLFLSFPYVCPEPVLVKCSY